MRSVGWNILVLSFVYLAAAQIPKECAAPPKYPHTRLDSRYTAQQKFSSGEKVYYNCAEDLTSSAGIRAVQCLDGKWTKLTLKCEKKSCGNAGDLPNGQFEYERNTYIGEKVYAVCNKGYTLKGPSYMICKRSGWSGEFPSCEVGDATCTTPAVENSVSRGRGVSVRVGDNVSFTCNQGFQLHGAQQITCGPDGQWQTPLPQCLPSPDGTPSPGKETGGCGLPQTIRGSNANLADKYITMTSFASGDRVHYVCDVGYVQASGSRFRKCYNGKWTSLLLRCELGDATCTTPAVENSVSRGRGVSVRVGDNVSFTCNQGFQLHGAQQITCGPDGQWQTPLPQCLPSPDGTPSPGKETGGCGLPQTIRGSNANLADKYITMTSFASGDRVHYVCDVGYVQARGSRFRKCYNGKWTSLLLRCERTLCGSAGEIVNGQFRYTGVEFGDKATAVCDEGHRLVGKATRNCLSKGWDGRVPVCEAVECDDPPVVKNAEMEGYQELPYIYRSVVRYLCKAGTLNGPREIWCTKDGTWNAPPPTCGEITCPSPNVPGAFWSGALERLHQYRDTISIECNQGYRRIGPSSITCGGDGRWTPGLPKCSPTPPHINWRS